MKTSLITLVAILGITSLKAASPLTVSAQASNVTLGQEVALQGRATDSDGNLDLMSFYLSGPGLPAWTFIANAPMYGDDNTVGIHYTPTAAGTYTLHIRAYDADSNVDPNGNITTNFTVYSTPPSNTAPITASASIVGNYVGDVIKLKGRATDVNSNLSSISFYLSGPGYPGWTFVGNAAAAGSDSTPEIFMTFSTPGEYTLHIRAYDSTGTADSNANITQSFTIQGRFKILIDVNQLDASEINDLDQITSDGVWAITVNSSTIDSGDWPDILDELNADEWTISEDNPDQTLGVDGVSANIGRKVDGAMFYYEGRPDDNTILTNTEINDRASHTIPSYGTLGNRVIVMSRSYAIGDPRRAAVNTALSNSNTAGICFEINPTGYMTTLDIAGGMEYALETAGKDCYLLIAPNQNSEYLEDIQNVMDHFASSGQLGSTNLYFVLAVYGRNETDVGFLTGDDSNPDNSIKAAADWLKDYRAGLINP